MPLVVCLHTNIYDEDGEKRLRGDTWEASDEWSSDILKRDEDAERPARITVVQPKRGRPKKEASDETE